jgi:hypothetical protein
LNQNDRFRLSARRSAERGKFLQLTTSPAPVLIPKGLGVIVENT